MRMMSKELLLKLAADYSVLAEDLKKLAGEEAPAESEKEEKVDVPFEVEENYAVLREEAEHLGVRILKKDHPARNAG